MQLKNLFVCVCDMIFDDCLLFTSLNHCISCLEKYLCELRTEWNVLLEERNKRTKEHSFFVPEQKVRITNPQTDPKSNHNLIIEIT